MTEGGAVAGAIRDARLRQRLTQEQLAVKAGVVKATVQKIEAGRPVRARTLRDVMWALGMEEAGPAGHLTDDELIAELERRRPGSVRWVAHGDSEGPTSPPPGKVVPRSGDRDESAS